MSQYHFTLKGSLKRARDEHRYSTERPWTLEAVGRFWDTVAEYDTVNEGLYTYFRRFTNSYDLASRYLASSSYEMLDIQARSGKGSLFWHQSGKIKRAVCVDFSDYLLSLADKRLRNSGLDYSLVKISDFPLPFKDGEFDLVCTYETIEHVFDYLFFFQELTRVLRKGGLLILTCPNRAWGWVHWLTAVININHSEGPHRFLRRQELLGCVKANKLRVLAENSTILMPFNNGYSIRLDRFLERTLPERMKRALALRRTLVLSKPSIAELHKTPSKACEGVPA